MADKEISENVIKLFNNPSSDDRIKDFNGFNYVKLKRDKDGKKFHEINLLSYAKKCHYMVTVMKKVDEEVCLYNYDIKNEDLLKFLKAFNDNILSGKIIDIEKFIPEDLA